MEIVRIAVSSPSDVRGERAKVAFEVLDRLQQSLGSHLQLHIERRMWEDVAPEADMRGPQATIDDYLQPDKCDIAIGIFNRSAGTRLAGARYTGKTGSQHEVDTALEAWAASGKPRVLLYFKSGASQHPRLAQLQSSWGDRVLYSQYTSAADLSAKLYHHLCLFFLRTAGPHQGPGKLYATLQNRLNAWTTEANQILLRTIHEDHPPNVIDPRIKHHGRSVSPPGKLEHAVFDNWQDTSDTAARIAIVSSEGFGKSLLLHRFAKSRQRLRSVPEGDFSNRGVPLICLIEAGDKKARRALAVEDPWAGLRARILEKLTPTLRRTADTLGYVDLLADHGQVWLLVDALDEIGVSRKEEAVRLTESLEHLALNKINVILTCRTLFWATHVPSDFADWMNRWEIDRFDQDQARRLLANVRLPKGVLLGGGSHALAPWVLNPLLLRFLRELGTGKSQGWRKRVVDRTTLFEEWALHYSSREAGRTRATATALLELLGHVAMEMLARREKYVNLYSVQSDLAPDEVESATLGILVKDENGRHKFAHHSFLEFFVAKALSMDIEKLINTPGRHSSVPQLGKAELDYLYSSVYGFLSESLTSRLPRPGLLESRLIEVLRRDLARGKRGWHRCDAKESHTRTLRNIIEFTGMISSSEGPALKKLVDVLTRLLGMAAVHPCLRYNAARALERVHPNAPRPYFEYVSDWDEHGKVERFAKWNHLEREEAPYVVVGYRHGKGRSVGRQHRFAPNIGTQIDAELQKKVSQACIDTILDTGPTAQSAHGNEQWDLHLRVNCANTLIRWLDSSHEVEARRLWKNTKLPKQVRENLGIALDLGIRKHK